MVNEVKEGSEWIRLDCRVTDTYSNILMLRSLRKDVDSNRKCGHECADRVPFYFCGLTQRNRKKTSPAHS